MSGLKVPVNDAEPVEISVVADVFQFVLVKLSPLPPLRLDNNNDRPSGATNRMIRLPSKVWVRLLILTLAINPLVRLSIANPETTSGEDAGVIPDRTVLSGM